jgi:cytochrome c oxidase accessory protein FixG
VTDPVPAAPAGSAVIWLYEKQKTIHARSVSGWFTNWRWVLVWATQLAFYGLPWLPWNDRQAVLFDLASRRFYLGGLVLYPQDFIYLTGLLIVSAYGLFLVTAVAGRVWCGYACPQTVYTEMFMWIERRLEGDRPARIRLDAAPWSAAKLLRRGGKHALWITLALWTGFTFVGYFTPIKTLWAESFTLSFGPWEWFWVLFYGLATYGNAGFLREQVCKYMCPYARFQSAMFDKDTLIISYDIERGEPRGQNALRGRSSQPKPAALGDCIDCNLCVQVCPTGIDIRKGLQYECIGCAACIDVCNGVMDKMQYPQGLIRYDTQNGLSQHLTRAQRWRRVLRPRVLVYGAVLAAICGALAASLWLRTPFRVDVVRDRGTLARAVEDGRIENVYRLQLMNSSESAQRFRIRVGGLVGAQLTGQAEVSVAAAESRWVPVTVQLAPQDAQRAGGGAHAIEFEIERLPSSADNQVWRRHERSTFVVPR